MISLILLFSTGFAKITAPNLIGYDASANITCTIPKELPYVTWSIKKDGQPQIITDGTEATVFEYPASSTVTVNKTSEVWKGMLFPKECIYFTALFVIFFFSLQILYSM